MPAACYGEHTSEALGTFATVLVADPAALADARGAILRGERAVGWLRRLRLPARLVRHAGSVVRVAGWPAEACHGSAA